MTFNPHALTDQEIMDKLSEINGKLNFAARYSGDPSLTETMRNMAEQCVFVLSERAQQRLFDTLNKNAVDEKFWDETGESRKGQKTNGNSGATSAKKVISGGRMARSSKPVKE